MQAPEVSDDNLKQLEVFSDRLTDIVAKLEDHGYRRELTGVSTLYTAVQSKIPETILVMYQQWAHDNCQTDGLSTFVKWLAQHVIFKTEAEETRRKRREPRGESSSGGKKSSYQSTAAKSVRGCPLCQEDHRVTECKRWKEAKVTERWRIAKEKRLCFRCLKLGHAGQQCRSNNRCTMEGCSGTHHFHLHFDKLKEPAGESHANTGAAFGATGQSLNAPSWVLLRTVPVWVSSSEGRRIKLNAFLDDGSDTSFIRSDVATALGIQAPENHLTLSTLTDTNVQVRSKSVFVEVSSLEGDTKRKLNMWTMDELCSGMPIPDWSRHQDRWDHLKGLSFPKVPGRKTVDLLIGSD